jgi:hypothetical protein
MSAHPGEVAMLAAPLAGLVSMTVLHLLASRLGGVAAHLIRFILAFAVGLVAAVAVSWTATASLTWSDRIALLALHAASFVALSYGYFTFVNLTATSLRLRLLRDMLGATEKPIPTHQLTARYGSNEVVGIRVERLVAWKQLRRSGGRLRVDGYPLFRVLSLLIGCWRRVLFGDTRPPTLRRR